MAKTIEEEINEMSKKIEIELTDAKERQDKLTFLNLFIFYNDLLFSQKKPSYGKVENCDNLNDYENFEKLICLIPEENRIHSLYRREATGYNVEKIGRIATEEYSYYILLDENTAMELKCVAYTRTGMKTQYSFEITSYRNRKPLILKTEHHPVSSILLSNDYLSTMEIMHPIVDRIYHGEPAADYLPFTNLEETFINPLKEFLQIKSDCRKRKPKEVNRNE